MSCAGGSTFPELREVGITGALFNELLIGMKIAGEVVEEIDIMVLTIGIPRLAFPKSRSQLVLRHSTAIL